jgi:hypothetical protein
VAADVWGTERIPRRSIAIIGGVEWRSTTFQPGRCQHWSVDCMGEGLTMTILLSALLMLTVAGAVFWPRPADGQPNDRARIIFAVAALLATLALAIELWRRW